MSKVGPCHPICRIAIHGCVRIGDSIVAWVLNLRPEGVLSIRVNEDGCAATGFPPERTISMRAYFDPEDHPEHEDARGLAREYCHLIEGIVGMDGDDPRVDWECYSAPSICIEVEPGEWICIE